MPRHFDPALINDPFGDPGLYLDLVFERRALLFDIGDLSRLAPRKLLRVSGVFVTHRHMDHFAGFDQLLRLLLGREKTVCIYGPAGLIEAVEHKLRAYSWNLIEGYEGNLVFQVTEIDSGGRLMSAQFSGRPGSAVPGAKRGKAMRAYCSKSLASRFARHSSITARPRWLSLSKSGRTSMCGAIGSRPWGFPSGRGFG